MDIFDNLDHTEPVFNSAVVLYNEIFEYRKTHDLEDDCILDIITEYASDKNLNPIEVAQTLAEYEGFKNIVASELVKFKFVKKITSEFEGLSEEWTD
jgi:hypothetical protein